RLERTLKMFGGRVGQLARAVPMMMAALSTYHAQRSQIVVVAPPAELAHLMGVLASKYLPFAVVVPVEPGEAQRKLSAVLPFIAPMQMRDGKPTVYICRDFACDDPITDIDRLKERLSAL